jgi:DUF1009 family protein
MERFAILAGGGAVPTLIADGAVARGAQVHLVAIEGEADPAVVSRFPHTWVNWGAIGRMVRTVKREGAGRLVIAGSVTRPDLLRIRPDLGFFASLPTVLATLRQGGDDGVLSHVVRFFENQGIEVCGLDRVAPHLIMSDGPATRTMPDAESRADAARGMALLDALGPLDVGQGVVVRRGRIVAIEGVEGTDRMLQRVAAFGAAVAGSRSGVLVKAPKPGQEMRVDMPTIGPRTVSNAFEAGLSGIMVVAGATVVLDRAALAAQADAASLFVYGGTGLLQRRQRSRPTGARFALMSRGSPSAADLEDVAQTAATVQAVTPYIPDAAAASTRRHVLGVSAAEGAGAMLERVSALRQWGLRRIQKRRGAVAVLAQAVDDAAGADREAIVAKVASAGLAGIAVCGPGAACASDALSADADRHGLFLVAELEDR